MENQEETTPLKWYFNLIFIAFLITGFARAGDGRFTGLVYYHLAGGESTITEFEFGRVYFTYQKQVSENLRYKFQIDVDPSAAPRKLYIKNAKLDWKTAGGKVVIGLQSMNMFNVQEKTWGYRSVEKSPMDRKRFASSADLGLGYYRRLSNRFIMSLLVTNGSGYKNQEDDSFKKISLQGIWGETELNKQNGINVGGVISTERYKSESSVTENRLVAGVFGGLSTDQYRVGGELGLKNDSAAVNTSVLISGYGEYTLSEGMHPFIRIDHFNDGPTVELYGLAGISFNPETGLSVMPNIRYVKSGDNESISYFISFEFKI